MSGAQQSVSRQGVTVTKSLEREQFKTPAIILEFESDRETVAAIAVADRIPESVPVDDVGFHPEYGGEHWTIDGHRVRFEHRLDAGENYTTVYGIRDVDEEELEAVMEHELAVEVVTPEDSADDLDGIDALLSGNEDVVREVLAGERDQITPGSATDSESDVAQSSDESTAAVDAAGPATPEAPATTAETDDGAVDSDPESQSANEIPSSSQSEELAAPTPEAGAENEDVSESDSLAPPSSSGDELGPAGPDLDDEPDDADAGLPDSPLEDGDDDEQATESDAEESASEPEAVEEADEPAEDDEPEPAGVDDEPGRPARAGAEATPGSVASALVAELESGAVDPDDRDRLREALATADDSDDAPQVPGHVEARIEHLQTEVSDLAAYSDAMESFLEAYADGDSVLDAIEEDLQETADHLDSLESTIERTEERVDDVTATLDDIGEQVDSFDERLEETESELSAVSEQVDSIEGTSEAVADVREEVDALQDSLEDVESELQADLADLRSTVGDETVDRERVAEVESRAGTLEDDIEAVRDEIDELRSFRDQFSSAFGTDGEE